MREDATDNGSDGMSLSRSAFLLRIVKHKIQKQVIAAQRSTDSAAALQIHEQSLVHELSSSQQKAWGAIDGPSRSSPFSILVETLWTSWTLWMKYTRG